MRDRLIELIKRDNCRDPFNCSSQCKYVESDDCHSERLADLILADGWIRPPCKVGDMVYSIRYDKARKPFLKLLPVRSITIWKKGKITVFTSREDYLGETVFLTREEAEAKLQEGKG